MKKYRAVAVPGLPRFTGGAIGFIGYEFIHDVEPVVPRPPHDELKTPVMYFLVADQLLIFDRVQQTITILVNAILDDAESPGRRLRKCRRAKSSGSSRCSNSRANTMPSTVTERNSRRSNLSPTRRRKNFSRTSRPRKNTSPPATSSKWSARSGFPRRSRRRRWIFTARRATSIRRPICFCWSWTDSRSSARRRKFMSAARKARWRSARLPERAAAAKPRPKIPRSKKNCSPTRRNAPSTSCSWTSRATTSGASAISAACK